MIGEERIHYKLSNVRWWLFLVLLTATLLPPQVSSQEPDNRYHSDPIPLTSVGSLGKDSIGRALAISHGPAVVDLNGDGLADVFMWLLVGPSEPGPPTPPLVLLNDGAGGFVDGTAAIIAPPFPEAFRVGNGTIFVEDFNRDGQPDVWIGVSGLDVASSPGGQNLLLLSGQDGLLHDVTADNLPQLSGFTHGPSAADVDGDGDIDIWDNSLSDHTAGPPNLLLNDGTGGFTVVADLGRRGFNEIVGKNGRLPDERALSGVQLVAGGSAPGDMGAGTTQPIQEPQRQGAGSADSISLIQNTSRSFP